MSRRGYYFCVYRLASQAARHVGLIVPSQQAILNGRLHCAWQLKLPFVYFFFSFFILEPFKAAVLLHRHWDLRVSIRKIKLDPKPTALPSLWSGNAVHI